MLQNFIFIAVSTHSHIPCHSEAHYKLALCNSSLGICFFFYNNLRSWFKWYNLPEQYTLTQAALYTSPTQDPAEPYIVTDAQSSKYKQLRMYNRKGSLLYVVVITAILTWGFSFYDGAESD